MGIVPRTFLWQSPSCFPSIPLPLFTLQAKKADLPSAKGGGNSELMPFQDRSLPKKWIFPAGGLAALVWFLIRVIPKPSRANYPCQRVTAPMASGFVVWLLGLFD
jgi:hypothetical protein